MRRDHWIDEYASARCIGSMELMPVMLVGAQSGASGLRASALPEHSAFRERPEAFTYIYSTRDRACMSLTSVVADRLWLAPLGLLTFAGARTARTPRHVLTDELLRLLTVHSLDGTIVVLPDEQLALVLRQLEGRELIARRRRAAPWLHELALRASPAAPVGQV